MKDRALEQALGPGTGDEGRHSLAARALAKDGHAAGVTAKGCNIIAHPFQRPDLIQHAEVWRSVIGQAATFAKGRMGHPAERAKAVLHDDNHDLEPCR